MFEQETRTAFNRIKKERYQWGNKTGKHLAKILKKKISVNYIEKIQTSTGGIAYTTAEIAKNFQEYYRKLYLINQKDSPEKDKERKEKMEVFLDDLGLNKISDERFKAVEDPITEEEIRKTFKIHREG